MYAFGREIFYNINYFTLYGQKDNLIGQLFQEEIIEQCICVSKPFTNKFAHRLHHAYVGLLAPPFFCLAPPKSEEAKPRSGVTKKKFSALRADYFHSPLTFKNVPPPLS